MVYVIVVVGLARSGKDAFADRLVEAHGFKKYVFSDVLRNQLESEGRAVSKQAMAELGRVLRERHGKAVVAERLIDGVTFSSNSVLVGPRNIEEVDYVRAHLEGKVKNVMVVKVEASKDLRYGRRSGLDAQQIDLFFKRDEEDIKEKGMDKVLEAADVVVMNEGTLEEFEGKVDEFMRNLKQQK